MISKCKTIILLEDDQNLRAIVGEGLREYGYDVIEAKKTNDAMGAMSERDGNIILIADRALGEEGPNGFQLAASALELYPNLRVIYVSGTHIAIRHRKFSIRERGLLKPYALSQLLTLVRQLAATQPTSTISR